MSVSVLIPTKNEASILRACLTAVAWSDDVVVVDSCSTDGTSLVAEEMGARVISFTWNQCFPKKKNWSLEHINFKHSWILIVDADEIITPDLRDEILLAVKSDDHDGYYLNRRFMFLGKWIRYCGYYPSWNLRLFRHHLGRYERLHDGDSKSGDNEIHEHIEINGKISKLKSDMLHFAYPDLYTWVEKHNRYSNWEAAVEVEGVRTTTRSLTNLSGPIARRRLLRGLSRRLPFRSSIRFVYSYVFRLGFLDGYEGFMFCRLLATYEMLSAFKAYELKKTARIRDYRGPMSSE